MANQLINFSSKLMGYGILGAVLIPTGILTAQPEIVAIGAMLVAPIALIIVGAILSFAIDLFTKAANISSRSPRVVQSHYHQNAYQQQQHAYQQHYQPVNLYAQARFQPQHRQVQQLFPVYRANENYPAHHTTGNSKRFSSGPLTPVYRNHNFYSNRTSQFSNRQQYNYYSSPVMHHRTVQAQPKFVDVPYLKAANELTEYFKCPISQTPMKDPVIAKDGCTYERINIENWFRQYNTSPVTGEPMSAHDRSWLVSNKTLKSLILEYDVAVQSNWLDKFDLAKQLNGPFLFDVMTNPVVARDGHSYESSEIQEWYMRHDTSPMERSLLPEKDKTLVPNFTLKAIIENLTSLISHMPRILAPGA